MSSRPVCSDTSRSVSAQSSPLSRAASGASGDDCFAGFVLPLNATPTPTDCSASHRPPGAAARP
eukprot:6095206-Prymnesium_polylepis.1